MSASARIDTLQDDRGLQTCFDAANVDKSWSEPFVKAHGITTLDDYIYLVDGSSWETSLKELLGAVAELKDKRLVLARFKAAYESGMAAVKQSQAQPKADDASDTVLPDSTMTQVSADWKRKYGIMVEPHLDPSDSLRSRVYKEFHKGTMTVIEARRVRSMVHVSIPKTTENVKLSDTIQLQFNEETAVSIGNIVEYYWALRVLANAWSWGGLFEAVDHDGARKTFMPLTDAVNYADFSLRCTVEHGQGSLVWYQKNDLLTRSKMAALIRRGYVGASALAEALKQCHLEWRSSAHQASWHPEQPRPTLPRAQGVPEPEGPPPPKRPRKIKADVRQTVSMLKGGRAFCKAWNDQRGCRGCDKLHACDAAPLAEGPRETSPAPSLGDESGRPLVPPLGRQSLRPAEAPLGPRSVHLAPDQDAVAHGGSLAEKLAAAKPVVWRGKGDLPQFPWASPPLRGSWLVLDLWAGYSGLCIALLAMGVHFYALAADTDPVCRACSQATMPHIVHATAVEHIQARVLRAVLQRRKFRGIILGGGSPCQGNSALNASRAGLGDKRSLQPSLLAQLVQDLEAEPLCQGLEIVAFLENVASMPSDVQRQYDRWLRSSPVIINSASCGWVQRRRMFWLSCRGRGLSETLQPPADWAWVPAAGQSTPELVYGGKKPIPAQVSWLDGFSPLLDPAKVMAEGGKGAMHTFTREFFHPTDRLRQASPEAAHRFEVDHRRFPPSAVAAVQGSQHSQTQVRNSLLGNGFHLPSVMAIFMMLPALLSQAGYYSIGA
eukprot:s568_g26.t1